MTITAVTYRDTFDTCPRCGVALLDARSARGCRECGGMWLQEGVLHEMVLEMLPPGLYGKLAIAARPRDTSVLSCPACHEPMEPVAMHAVAIDRCAKHGLWFDAEELFGVLRRSADPTAGTFVPGSDPPEQPVRRLPARAPAPAPPTPPAEPAPEPPTGPLVILRVTRPDGTVSTHRFERALIKIGRLARSHLHLDGESVSRMHALIEATGPEIQILDLGSAAGTIIGGERVTKQPLRHGDVIEIGGHRIDGEIPSLSA